MSARHNRRRRGFTLIEALMATALLGAILAALATVTAQWLPNWNRGFANVQRTELFGLGLERLVSDVTAAEFVPGGREYTLPVFDGTELSMTFVRMAFGPNANAGLELVRIAEVGSDRGPMLVRTRARYVPVTAETVNDPANFTDPVILMRAPYRARFSYAGRGREWRDTWRSQIELPKAIRVQVRDATTDRILTVSTAALIHADMPSDCVLAEVLMDCLARQRENPAQPQQPPQ